ncbi:MAG: VWA domain-containing protein [Pseudomonadota bacterium]
MPASDLGTIQAPAKIGQAERLAFPGSTLTAWTEAIERLRHAGYGASVHREYQKASLGIAAQLGCDPALQMARSTSFIAIKAGPRTAALYCSVARAVARQLAAPTPFENWAGQIDGLAKKAPDVLWPLLNNTERVLDRVGLDTYIAWVQTGLRLAGLDPKRRRSFFALESNEAQQLLERHAGTLMFQSLEPRLRAELRALFGVAPPLREIATGPHGQIWERSSFASGVVQLPARYTTFEGRETATYRAAVAHIGAHLTFGSGKFPLGQLKPLQVAVVSLIEDARVELLAMRQMPGLVRLWRPLHTAPPEGPRTATSLFARLARALIDPDFAPSDGWVRKGRGLFFAASDHWGDPRISRHIGNLLGNDLGQLRVQFNAKNYVVAPAYRDDNMGLWDFPDPPDAEAEQSLSIETDDLRRSETGDQETQRESDNRPKSGEVGKLRPVSVASVEGREIARLPEYDYAVGLERPDWVTLRTYAPAPGDPMFWSRLQEQYGPLVERAEKMVRAATVGNRVRLRRQIDGEKLDLTAAIDAAIEFRMGHLPNPAVYEAKSPPMRSIATHLLLDTSQSTADCVPGSGQTILDIERDAAALLALAMDRLGDPLMISAFASCGREDIRVTPIKAFDEPVGLLSGMALSGLRSGYSTRLGAVMRYAGRSLQNVREHRRLVLTITDGEPSDIDVPDRRYLVADARRAVQSLAVSGIDCFCLALGAGAAERARTVFGPHGFVQINRIESLPEKLQALYVNMTR